MPAFRYRALGRTGAIDAGLLTAKDLASASRQLRDQQLTPLSVTPASQSPQATSNNRQDAKAAPDPEAARSLLSKVAARKRPTKTKKRFDREDVLRFTGEMSVLLKAGLPLDRAIKVQIESAGEGPQKALLQELLDALKGGKALSAGLDKRPDVFNNFYIKPTPFSTSSTKLSF